MVTSLALEAPDVAVVRIPVWVDNYAWLLRLGPSTWVVDAPEAGPVLGELAARGWRLDGVLNTHHHPDHVGANLELKQRTGCRVLGPAADRDRIPGLDVAVEDGTALTLGGHRVLGWHLPGHTRGHLAWVLPDDGLAFVGDTLFAMGCGRLFEGTPQQMWASLQRLAGLPPSTLLFCAHEYTLANGRFALTVDPHNAALRERVAGVERLRAEARATVPFTLADELATNPFLRADQPDLAGAVDLPGRPAVEVFAALRALKDRS